MSFSSDLWGTSQFSDPANAASSTTPMSQALNGFGSKIQVLDIVDNTTWVTVGRVRDINGLSVSRAYCDSSSLDSEADECVPGRISGGEVSFDCIFDPADETQFFLWSLLVASKTTNSFRILLAPSVRTNAWNFNGCVTKFQT